MKILKMRSVRAAVVLFLLLAIGGVSIAESPADREPSRVPITIDSRPDFAEVYLDGKFIGSTGITLRLAAGQYTIELRRKGFETWTRELTVLPGMQSRVVALLEPQPK